MNVAAGNFAQHPVQTALLPAYRAAIAYRAAVTPADGPAYHVINEDANVVGNLGAAYLPVAGAGGRAKVSNWLQQLLKAIGFDGHVNDDAAHTYHAPYDTIQAAINMQ